MAAHAVTSRETWSTKIKDWQSPVVNDKNLPERYRSALFNELYYVVDGSVLWFEYEKDGTKEKFTEDHLAEWGRFGYMESWEYLMINTYDVHYYASEALLENWPQLQVSVQLEFADQIKRVDHRAVQALMDGTWGEVKTKTRIPHDMGHPLINPWLEVNCYALHDSGEWKDLNLKFILLSLRDFERALKHSPNGRVILSHLLDCSISILEIGKKHWDLDKDGMIENGGTADQTYDLWPMKGTSAYCGSLWLAALEAARQMAVTLDRKEESEDLRVLLQRAKEAFVRKLWNGRYFNFDESSDAIMADQLNGIWFLLSLDGHSKNALIDKAQIKSALDTIFENNVKKFGDGNMGAVNGMTSKGRRDLTSIQSEEMWTGTSYALASFYALMGDRERCFELAEGVYEVCWEKNGLQYQTPEAIFKKHYYRAIGYMRPLAIWNIRRALQIAQESF